MRESVEIAKVKKEKKAAEASQQASRKAERVSERSVTCSWLCQVEPLVGS